jgi:hypothetical protein
MSYDYLMFHRPGFLPQWIKRLQAVTSRKMGSLGTPEELMKRINELFPATRWEKNDRADLKALLSQIKGGGVDPNAPVWFGGMAPTFQLSADVDGNVKSMTVSRVERSEIRLLCRRLGLIYLDLQADGLLGMLFR